MNLMAIFNAIKSTHLVYVSAIYVNIQSKSNT